MSTATTTEKPAATTADIRQWAREQGLVVGNRGVLPASVVEAYSERA